MPVYVAGASQKTAALAGSVDLQLSFQLSGVACGFVRGPQPARTIVSSTLRLRTKRN
jgi:hypothetical protein